MRTFLPRVGVSRMVLVAPAPAQQPDTTARRDSIARADSAARADSIAIVRELERIRGEARPPHRHGRE